MGLIFNYFPNPNDYPDWLIEDIQETIEDLELEPGITPSELRATSAEYWNRARWLYEKSQKLESQADILERIARDEEEFGVKWTETWTETD